MIRMKGDSNSTRYTAQPLNSPILERDIIQPNPYRNSSQIIFQKLHVRLPTFKHQRPVGHVPWGSFQHISGMINRIKIEDEVTMNFTDDRLSNLISRPRYGRLMMLAMLANIGMTGTREEEYETLLAIRVQNS